MNSASERISRPFACLALALALASGAGGAVDVSDACVTLLADVYGAVTVASSVSAKKQDRWPVQHLQCFVPRKVLSLEAGARATLYFPATGEAAELRGPGRFEIAAASVLPVSDAPAPSSMRLSDAFRGIKLDRSNLAPAGVRMRYPSPGEDIVLIEPRGIVLSTDAPVFRWRPNTPSTSYRFRLAQDPKGVIYEVETPRTELTVPPDVLVAAGERLRWRVERASSERSRATHWQDFVVATPDARSLAEEIDRTTVSSSAAERNQRDLLLLQSMAGRKTPRYSDMPPGRH